MGLFNRNKIECCGNCNNRLWGKMFCLKTGEKIKDINDVCSIYEKE